MNGIEDWVPAFAGMSGKNGALPAFAGMSGI
jgi:hypothetical protein